MEFQGGVSAHRGCKLKGCSIDDEFPVALMMDGLRVLLGRIDPRLHHFQDENIVFRYHAGIDHFTFEIGETFRDQGRLHQACRNGGEHELLEFVHRIAMAVADLYHFGRKLCRWNGNNTFAGRLEGRETVIPFADHASDSRRLNSIIMCHDMVMTLARPFCAVVSNTTGPGSSN